MKAASAKYALSFTDIPNIGPRIAADFVQLGFKKPQDLIGRDPFELYLNLCKKTKCKQDPCVLDTFMAAIDFMNGAKAKPWWDYTAKRKELYAPRLANLS